VRGLVQALVAVLVGTAAFAQTASTPSLALYKSGDYRGAIRAGLAENDEDGFDVAARAALAEETLRDSPCLECLKRAEGYARRAIAAGGKRPESYVYLAAALGHEARVVGTIAARLANYPEQTKATLDAAYRIRPDFALTLAGLGGWNVEVARTGGRLLAAAFYDASFDKGVEYFRRAVAAEPGNLVIHFQFALALASYDLDAERAAVARELAAAANGTPASAYESAIKQHAQNLADLLAKGDDDAVLTLVHKYQGYP